MYDFASEYTSKISSPDQVYCTQLVAGLDQEKAKNGQKSTVQTYNSLEEYSGILTKIYTGAQKIGKNSKISEVAEKLVKKVIAVKLMRRATSPL